MSLLKRATGSHPKRGSTISRSANRQIQTIRHLASSLEPETDQTLRHRAEDLREEFCGHGLHPDGEQRAFALGLESIRRTLGITLYDVQLRAALVLARGAIAEMQTGEGKTLTAIPAAVFRGLIGTGAHVVTTNAYLAERDCDVVRPACEMLGLSVQLLKEDGGGNDGKRAAYRADITYGTGYEFGFDYLRDQLTMREKEDWALGEEILRLLDSSATSETPLLQRGLANCIIDEVDHVLLDEAISPLILSEQSNEEAPDAGVYRCAQKVAINLHAGSDFEISSGEGSIRLTPEGMQSIHAPEVPIPIDLLRRAWAEYIENALRANWRFRRDVHYVVVDDSIQIVDASTGRIFSDRSWQDGLHQAVEAKEGLRVSAQKKILARITRQRFYRLYQSLSGMTGTAAGFEEEFDQVYGLKVETIPPRLPNQRRIQPMRIFKTRDAKYHAIAESVRAFHRTGRPVLVGTKSISESEELAERLTAAGLSFALLNGMQDADEASVVAESGEIGRITIATNMAGRGTDIKLSTDAKERGGLHVVVAECHESGRVDRQLVGRAGRQGDPGSAQSFVSAEDDLIAHHGHWLAKQIQRMPDPHGEVFADLDGHIRRLQQVAERTHYAARIALLRADTSSSHTA